MKPENPIRLRDDVHELLLTVHAAQSNDLRKRLRRPKVVILIPYISNPKRLRLRPMPGTAPATRCASRHRPILHLGRPAGYVARCSHVYPRSLQVLIGPPRKKFAEKVLEPPLENFATA
jgi:hypothetical protein